MVKKITLLLLVTALGLNVFAQDKPASANEILENAFSKAKAEKKNVFIIFHASWCGWCRKMDTTMSASACNPFFDKNYVIAHLTVLESNNKKQIENPGAQELYEKYAPKNSGIPFWLVYNAKTKQVIGDAKLPDGTNSGCPASDAEVTHFINVLKKSSKIDKETAEKIYTEFRKNEVKH